MRSCKTSTGSHHVSCTTFYWLPTSQWKSKLVTMALKVLHHLTPVHLSSLTKCQLRPQSLYSYHTGPKLLECSKLFLAWSFELFFFFLLGILFPQDLCMDYSFSSFKSELKCHLREAFPTTQLNAFTSSFLSQSLVYLLYSTYIVYI